MQLDILKLFLTEFDATQNINEKVIKNVEVCVKYCISQLVGSNTFFIGKENEKIVVLKVFD